MTTIQPKIYIAQAAAQTPDKIAVIYQDDKVTFAELNRLIDDVVGQLKSAGVQPGDYVAASMINSLSWLVAFFAILNCDALVFLLPPDSSAEELQEILTGVTPCFALISDEFDSAASLTLAKLVGQVLSLSNSDHEIVIGKNSPAVGGQVTSNVKIGDGSNLNFMRMLTSGSSGVRKQIMRTPEQMQYGYDSLVNSFNITDHDVILNVAPPHHIAGIGTICLAMRLGLTLVLENGFVPTRVIKDIEINKASVLIASPFVFDIMAKSFIPSQDNLASLRCAISTGAPLTLEVYKLFREKCRVPLHELYGATEVVFATVHRDEGEFVPGLVGQPVPGTTIKIFDDNLNEVGPEVVGTIGINSPSLISEYWIGATASRQGFKDDFVLPGDRGYLDRAGNLHFVGRSNLIINVAGEKVDIIEVEKILSHHPGVSEVVVYPRHLSNLDVVAAKVVSADPNLSDVDLMRWCRDRLLAFKVPKQIEFVDSLPRDKTGKINRRALL